MGIVSYRAFTEPDRIRDTEVRREGLLIILRPHPRIPDLRVSEQPFFRDEHQPRSVHLDAAPFENESLTVVGPCWHGAGQSRDALYLRPDQRITLMVVVLRPAVESPVHELDASIC